MNAWLSGTVNFTLEEGYFKAIQTQAILKLKCYMAGLKKKPEEMSGGELVQN